MPYVLALDQGTTSSRALVFDRRGRVVATAQQEFPQHYPRPGWVEHDPRDLWETTRRVALAAVAEANLDRMQLAAIGLTNQRETTLLWERATGRPLAPAIVWQDRRTADLCARLRRAGLEPLFRRKTGLLLDPYFSGTKLRWLLRSGDAKCRLVVSVSMRSWAEVYIEDLLEQGWVVAKGPVTAFSTKGV